MYMTPQGSQLVDYSFYHHMNSTLQQCHNNRMNIYYYIFNIGICVLFFIICGIILYYCYKNKQTDQEKRNQMYHDQQYVLSKIRFYKDEMDKQDQMVSQITQLPVTNMEHF